MYAMRSVFSFVVAASIGAVRMGGEVPGRDVSIAGALSWYTIWNLDEDREKVAPTQVCRGERRGVAIHFRCDPLGVVVSVVVDRERGCMVTSMGPSAFESDGLKVKVPTSGVDWNLADTQCGELPREEGPFELAVRVRAREVDVKSSEDAPAQVIEFFRETGQPGCLVRFPIVRLGDPFYHVYEECKGALTIWEFPIRKGRVSGFPHWHYDEKHWPAGTPRRREQTDLWWKTLRL